MSLFNATIGVLAVLLCGFLLEVMFSLAVGVVRDAWIAVLRERENIRKAAVEDMATRQRAEFSAMIEQFRAGILRDIKVQGDKLIAQMREAATIAGASKGVTQ